ncbi:MAG: hypothetical protein E7637_03170 [Ruminococcaceae bacterium]|nr:hypothetical protein [Oscillospiraceae bacterium]
MKRRPYRPKRSFRERFFAFWMGRNGNDALGITVFWVAVVINIVNLFLGLAWLACLSVLLSVYYLFRIFSRNVIKRRRENQAFCAFWKRIKNFFVLQKNQRKDRKTHVYKKCVFCKKVLRLPRIKGSHTVRCPCCDRRFDMTIK